MRNKMKTTAEKEQVRPALVPKLRFPEFRDAEGWTLEAGDSLFNQINDRNPEPGLNVLAITQEYGAIPRHMIDYHVSVTEKSIESYKVVRVGDFIISLRSFQGGIEYSRYHGICSPAYVILRRRGKGSDEYFRHYLKTDRFIRILTKNLEGLRDGKMISFSQFSELQLPIPTPAEQEKIAECLRSVDELIAAQARKVDALKTHKKGLMQQLFPREGETQPRLRFPEFQNAGEWKVMPLGELVELQSGFAFSSSYFGSDGTKLVTPKNFTKHGHGNFEETVSKYTTEEVPQRFICSPGDLLVLLTDLTPTCELLGKPLLLQDKDGTVLLNQRVARVEPCASKLESLFLKYVFLSESYSNRIIKTATGSTVKHSSNTVLQEIPLFHPALSEQQRIATCLSSLDALITAETEKHEAVKTHKKGLMQQLFPSLDEVVP
jgi:type I restriction enzyme S subunit